MAKNRFFTILIVPEKTQNVRKIVVPHYIVKGAAATIAFILVLSVIMVLDYANVMSQITENKKLHVENRQLRQAVQIFKDKIITMESTLDRIKTFATKLRIITNIEESSSSMAPLAPQPPALPYPSSPSGGAPGPAQPSTGQTELPLPDASPTYSSSTSDAVTTTGMEADTDEESMLSLPPGTRDEVAERNKRKSLIAALKTESAESLTLSDADTSLFVKTEFEKLDASYAEVQSFAEEQEYEVQFILEQLGEKRAILAGTPTRLPTLGYITSEYGVRISPFDSRRKMHEGIDIANRFGADVIAAANGFVEFAGNKPGYGKIVILDHGNGLETYYAHLSRAYINVGDRVKRGQRIAAVGSSGHSTGPHLHYEVRANSLPVDPCWYVLDQPTVCRSR